MTNAKNASMHVCLTTPPVMWMYIFPYTWGSLCWRQGKSLCLRTNIILLVRKLDHCVIFIYKKCIFFVVPGYGEVLLGMPDIELLNILHMNCNTVGTEKEEKVQIATWKKIASSVQEVSTIMQTQAQKGVVLRQTVAQDVTQMLHKQWQ